MTNVICDYCDKPVDLVTGKTIYPHRADLHGKFFYSCKPCEAYVGCHPNSDKPLGRLANAELRAAKSAAHRAFDPLWRQGNMTRSNAYYWLAGKRGLPAHKCHIGMFDVAQCKQVVSLVGLSDIDDFEGV